jgi:hypothetical protein
LQVTLLSFGACPVCGYRNQGVQVGTARPGMRQLRMQAGSIGFFPGWCEECGGPMDPQLIDLTVLDAETTAKLRAWQERQRARRSA